MNPAIIIIVALGAIVIWLMLSRHDMFVPTENFIDESIARGIHEEAIDVEFETEKHS